MSEVARAAQQGAQAAAILRGIVLDQRQQNLRERQFEELLSHRESQLGLAQQQVDIQRQRAMADIILNEARTGQVEAQTEAQREQTRQLRDQSVHRDIQHAVRSQLPTILEQIEDPDVDLAADHIVEKALSAFEIEDSEANRQVIKGVAHDALREIIQDTERARRSADIAEGESILSLISTAISTPEVTRHAIAEAFTDRPDIAQAFQVRGPSPQEREQEFRLDLTTRQEQMQQLGRVTQMFQDEIKRVRDQREDLVDQATRRAYDEIEERGGRILEQIREGEKTYQDLATRFHEAPTQRARNRIREEAESKRQEVIRLFQRYEQIRDNTLEDHGVRPFSERLEETDRQLEELQQLQPGARQPTDPLLQDPDFLDGFGSSVQREIAGRDDGGRFRNESRMISEYIDQQADTSAIENVFNSREVSTDTARQLRDNVREFHGVQSISLENVKRYLELLLEEAESVRQGRE